MKKLIIIFIVFITLTGCKNSIKPIDVTITEFDLSEALTILEVTWKPVSDMTNTQLETKPDKDISSMEQFFDSYNFEYMDNTAKSVIFETIVDNKDDEVVKDDKGNIIFLESVNIPTIYDDGVKIKKAYIKDSKFSEEYSNFDIVELVIEEEGNDSYYRKNIFRKSDEGEWILHEFEGTISISW